LLVAGVLYVLWTYAIAISFTASHSVPIDSSGSLAVFDHPKGLSGIVEFGGFFSLLASWIVWLVLQVPKYRRSSGERRLQLKWLYSGAAVFVVALIAELFNASGLAGDVAVLGESALPIALGIAILRFRLYEIDRIVSRTISYALLTVVLVGTFVGLVALTTDTFAVSGRVGVAASTLAAAALFNPLRVRVQRLVDRRFNRARYDAEAVVAAFTARLRDAVEIDVIHADLLEAVNRAVQPTHASVWIKP
jgi:hypothetical protein